MTRDMISDEALDEAQLDLLHQVAASVGEHLVVPSRALGLLASKGLIALRPARHPLVWGRLSSYGRLAVAELWPDLARHSAPPPVPCRIGILETYGPAEVQR